MKYKTLLASLVIIAFASTAALKFPPYLYSAVPGNCGERSLFNSRSCQELEQQILRSTVRFVLQSWAVNSGETGYDIDHSVGHATVMDGRYFVTHNHFDPPLHLQSGESEAYVVVYLFNSDGERLFKGPLSEFELVREDEETLVFAHRDAGFFEKLGFESAEFQSWAALSLEAGMTVAQIDWNGNRTRVDWVTIQEVIIERGTPRLVLAGGVMPGASGGGIFWNGTHVANNWRMEEQIGFTGEVVGAVTTVALNSAGVLSR